MRRIFAAGLIGAVALAGAVAIPPGAARASGKEDGYNEWLVALGKAASADPKYNRIPLDTEAQTKTFMYLTHQLYRKQIGANQYRAAAISQYPGKDYEVSFIIAQLP